MAGPTPLSADPALIKYQNMYVNRHKYFRWTPRTALISFVFIAVVPGAFYYIGARTDGKYEMRGKRRGDTIVEW